MKNLKLIEIGPINSELLEPIKYIIQDKKGKIKNVEISQGYAYRALEKLAKGKTYTDALYFIERICGICNFTHTTTFCQGIESILGIRIPDRAAYIRVVSLELERIHSHLLQVSESMHAIAEDKMRIRLILCREKVLAIYEEFSQNKTFQSGNAVGGVKNDISPKLAVSIIKTLYNVKNCAKSILSTLNGERVYSKMRGKGVLTQVSALELGTVGPVARGSGVDLDMRKVLPYAAYGKIDFSTILKTEGDVEARVRVRLEEILESVKIIQTAVENMPEGPIAVAEPPSLKGGMTSSRTEAPRGELLHFIELSDKGVVLNYHLRTPTKQNLPAIKRVAVGENIEGFVSLVNSFDPCIACNDSSLLRT
jgi:ech hydrogenase subunit E